jgi:hypothetical protein
VSVRGEIFGRLLYEGLSCTRYAQVCKHRNSECVHWVQALEPVHSAWNQWLDGPWRWAIVIAVSTLASWIGLHVQLLLAVDFDFWVTRLVEFQPSTCGATCGNRMDLLAPQLKNTDLLFRRALGPWDWRHATAHSPKQLHNDKKGLWWNDY